MSTSSLRWQLEEREQGDLWEMWFCHHLGFDDAGFEDLVKTCFTDHLSLTLTVWGEYSHMAVGH